MGITILLTVSLYGLMICEFYIFLWFVVRAIGLYRGKTDFTVSWKIPLFYLFYSLGVGYFISFVSSTHGLSDGSPLSPDEKIRQYVLILALVNITTPLYPILAYLKSVVANRQQGLLKGDGDINKQEKSDS